MPLNFTRVTYVDEQTVIGAQNLNDIQGALLALDSNKVEKEQGKGLSTEDYSTAEKEKLGNVKNVANLTYVEVLV